LRTGSIRAAAQVVKALLRRRLIVGAVLAVLGIIALRDLARLGDAVPWRTMDDFADFYCAGAALNAGVSPYTYEPLRTCEHLVNTGASFRGRLFAANRSIAIPAPQPLFDFLPFRALARLKVPQARFIDAVAILLAVVLCAAALARLGVPLDVGVAALALSTGYVELNTGQVVPFALLALVLCGLALAAKRDRAAGVAAVLTAIEPSLGIPVVAAALLFAPRARLAILLTAALLAIVSLAQLGLHGTLGYLVRVLPAHAASEIHFPYQYSLTYVLAYFGVPAAIAQPAGELSYFALVGMGLWLGLRSAHALGRRELLVFLPAVCAVTGGTFVHQEELCFALPAALVLAVASRGRLKAVAAAAVCVLSVPWIVVWGVKQIFAASLFLCAFMLVRLRTDLRVAVITLACIAATVYAFEVRPPHLPVPLQPAQTVYAPGELAERAWRDYTEQRSTRDFLWFAIKLPTWLALLGLLSVAFLTGSRRDQRSIGERADSASI
jgi:Glycosyltransferase family 87